MTCVINLIVDPNIVEISSLCTSITFFGLSDLKEILEVLNKSNLEALRLQHARPLKCKLFLQVTGYNTITTRFCSTGFACVNSKIIHIWHMDILSTERKRSNGDVTTAHSEQRGSTEFSRRMATASPSGDEHLFSRASSLQYSLWSQHIRCATRLLNSSCVILKITTCINFVFLVWP